MVKHTYAIRRHQPKNCLSVFDHFVGLRLRVNISSNILLAKFSTKICFEDQVVSRSQGKLNKEMTEVSSACYMKHAQFMVVMTVSISS